MKALNQQKTELFRNILLITLGSLLYALNFDLFLEPGGISSGGVSGIAMIIVYAAHPKFLTVGILNAMINIPLFLCGLKKIGRHFFFGSLYSTVLTSVFLDLFARILPVPTVEPLVAALFGGPFASTCYVVGLQMAGSIVVPISALCPAIGAILARFLFRQPLTPRMMLGILICLSASALIGFSSMGGIEARPHMMLGLFFGFLAALGWGIEGCVCGYGVSIIDSEVGITIREVTIGISNLIILVPILGWIGQTDGFAMLGKALADVDSMKWFVVAGFLCYFNFMCWYRGNAMCGAALGMACNGAYSFWGPFFCWLILGVVFGLDGWNMVPVAWVGAVLMVVGIFTIATNPLALFHRKEQ